MLKRIISCVAALMLFPAAAQATYIPSGSSFDVSGMQVQATTSSTFDQATSLTFNPPVELGGFVNAVFGLPAGTIGSVSSTPIDLNVPLPQPISKFFDFESNGQELSFTLSSIANILRIPGSGIVSPGLKIDGTGILKLTGYDDTPGNFTLSTSNTGAGVIASFSSSVISTSAVPEPATWASFIAGFGMIGATLRRRRALTVGFA